jgi:hypothetical protein
MKFFLGLLGFLLLASASSMAMSQGVMTVRQVLAECPDIDAASACPGVATQYLASRPPRSDAQIVNLVLDLAAAAQQPRVTMEACLDTAEGMLVLADGVSNAGQATQIRDIAEALCLGTRTAAIPRRNVGPFSSLSGTGGAVFFGGDGGNGPGPGPGPGPAGGGCPGNSTCNGNSGGSSASTNALAHPSHK